MERPGAVISGSFKFKPEIDSTREALEELGVEVLEPSKGWLIMSPVRLQELAMEQKVRPLPSEEGLSAREIENRFFGCNGKSRFCIYFERRRLHGDNSVF